MSALDVANQQALAKFQNAQGQWLVMHWNTLSALASLNAVPVENRTATHAARAFVPQYTAAPTLATRLRLPGTAAADPGRS
jgi:hypothetical protein